MGEKKGALPPVSLGRSEMPRAQWAEGISEEPVSPVPGQPRSAVSQVAHVPLTGGLSC